MNPEHPRTLNALKHGLFAAHDFIREGEHEEYAETSAALTRELSPVGVLETTFTTEIMGATWRLRRCRLIESGLAASTDDGSVDKDAVAKEQKSVDRARAQTFTRLHRSIAELRKIQTEHVIREQIHAEMPGLTDSRQVLSAVKLQNRMKSESQQIPDLGNNPGVQQEVSFCNEPEPLPEPEISFCKPAPIAAVQPSSKPRNTPRNAPCPCRSGLKFKKCCGKGAPAVLTMAA